MYVCLCEGVTDSQIRRAVEGGMCTMRQLQDELGVARNCGRCACYARSLLDESLAARTEPELFAS
ncbi:MAG: bacterioferritin-associated ferredoxin [Betaproteobacteria bacterium]|jgi:bacterioferritin-associated ferredoxin